MRARVGRGDDAAMHARYTRFAVSENSGLSRIASLTTARSLHCALFALPERDEKRNTENQVTLAYRHPSRRRKTGQIDITTGLAREAEKIAAAP